MKIKLTLFVTVLAVALFGVGCVSVSVKPPVPHAVKFEGHWYAFFPDTVNWDDALRICKERGGHLVYIESNEENRFVAELSQQKSGSEKFGIWIGAKNHKGEWKWLDGKSVSANFANWGRGNKPGLAPNEPTHPAGQMTVECRSKKYEGTFTSANGKILSKWWDGVRMEHLQAFVCEWE